jgi:hypothetical protein
MSHLPKMISGISRQGALNPPCLPAGNTLVSGSSSRRMDSLPKRSAKEEADKPSPKSEIRKPTRCARATARREEGRSPERSQSLRDSGLGRRG